MTTINTLAAEFNVQPYQLAEFLDLPVDFDESAELSDADEAWMRKAWAIGAEVADND